ncbi:MAG: EamA family transporter [Robiginitomaculum sp.]|nr:MAG: EamA family transporter [Robiginitomaculum sp.]
MKFSRPSYRALPIEVETADNRQQIVTAYMLAAFGAALFATKAIFIKLAYESSATLDPMTLLTMRMGLSLPVYAAITIWALRSQKHLRMPNLSFRHYVSAGAMGLIGYYMASILDFTGLVYITAQLERLILFTYPACVMILGALFFGKKVSFAAVCSMFLAYLGLAIIFARGSIAQGENVWLGAVLVFGAALSYAVFQLIAGKQIKRFGSALFTCMAMMCAGVGILTHFTVQSLVTGQFDRLQQPQEVWMLGAAIAIVATLIPSFMINIALGRIGAQAVAIVGMISPLTTIFLAITFLHEPFGVMDGIGTLVTIIGIGLFTWFSRQRKNQLN